MAAICKWALVLVAFGACGEPSDDGYPGEHDSPSSHMPGPLDGGAARIDAAPAASGPDASSRADGAHAPLTDGCAHCEQPKASWDLCRQLATRAGVTLREGESRGVSFARLLCDTVDLDRLARAPSETYVAKLASSYDRTSTREGGDGWYNNADHTVFVREEGDERVMMESVGAGVITRIWSPNPSGLIRIYVDYRTEPVIELPMADFLSGKWDSPFGEPFVFTAAHGYNAYLPIPYARYARIATTTTAPLYYQVNYREYAMGTQVEPFSATRMRELAPLAREVAAVLQDPDVELTRAGLVKSELRLGPDAPSASVTLGPAVVRSFKVRGFEATEQALRTTRVRVDVDGERTIDAPLGDLFGAGPGLREHDSLAASMHADALTLRWPMPVKDKLTVTLSSNGGAVPALGIELLHSAGLPDDYRLFHAQWTGTRSFNTAKPLDWTLIHFVGSGWYVGTSLNVTNPTTWWWGEGDEKIFIDGERFPSNFGTGTEDYFGFGWCSNELFARPWIGQTRADGPRNQGRSSQYRWHVSDAIPFRSELRMVVEVLHWISGLLSISLTQDAVAYWYASPGGAELAAPLAIEEFVVPPYTPSGEGPNIPYVCN